MKFVEKIPVDLATAEEQRHNLALELLWLQQAIISRKQVFLLKNHSIKFACRLLVLGIALTAPVVTNIILHRDLNICLMTLSWFT